MFTQEIEEHLRSRLIPFWENLRDFQYGGYYGYLDFDLNLDRQAVKGVILNSRILWFFSSAYKTLQEPHLLTCATHAWHFLRDACLDSEYGGVYWSMTYDGEVEDDTKHTYNQAFAIYALSAYYEASGDSKAKKLAETLFELIEKNCRDEVGYGEAYNREFCPVSNEKLSENGVVASKTMNTLLHVFEAYTELYRITGREDVRDKLKEILEIFALKVYEPDKQRQEVFFDNQWNSLIDLHSYGHDIETSWLLDRGCQVLEDPQVTESTKPIIKALAETIYERAYMDHSVINECENGIDNTDRIWWVQAESVVGFYNAWENEPDKEHYLQAAMDIWQYIKTYLMDTRPGSEWFWRLDENREPVAGEPIVEPWKCPYHNGRMCLEIINRRQNHDSSQI